MRGVKLIHRIEPRPGRNQTPAILGQSIGSLLVLLGLALGSEAGSAPPEPPATQPAGGSDGRTEEAPPPPATQPAALRPKIADEDLVLLVDYARSAFRSKLAGLPEQASRFRPIDLKGSEGIIHLTLRSHGVSLAAAQSAQMNIVDAAVAAGTLLGGAALKMGRDFEAHGDHLGIELEWLGPAEYLVSDPFQEGGRWTEELLHSFEPAVEGIGVEFEGNSGRTRPGQIITSNYSPDLALAAAESAINLQHIQKLRFADRIRYFRFWTYHLWQPSAQQRPVLLDRGEGLVCGESITPDGLDDATRRIGSYVRYRQRENGAFAPEFLPGADRYNEVNSARIQLRALRGLAAFARWTREKGDEAALARGLESFGKYLESVDKVDAGGPSGSGRRAAGQVLNLPGHEHHLELSGLMLSALCDASESGYAKDPAGLSGQAVGLATAILASQGVDGRLVLSLGPTGAGADSDELGAAHALVALAEAHFLAVGRDEGEELARNTERAVRAALGYYGRREAETSAAARATNSKAFALLYAATNDAKLSDYVFRTADELVRVQLNRDNCAYPELWGAINVRRPGLVGADSATYVEALAHAAALAARVGDAERGDRYREATLAGVRFLLQLEFRPAGCYYVRSPRDVLGGIRAAPWDHRIRVDDCAEVVLALIRARIALFGPPERP